jgi:hypothetical protein
LQNPAPAPAPSAAAPAPISDAERAWVHARAAELGLGAGQVHAAPLSPGPDGRIVLSADPAASAVAPAPALLRASAGAGPGAAVLAVEAVRVGEGQSLVVQAPGERPVKLLAAALEVADGGRVVMEANVELHVARASFGEGSRLMLVGADGEPGGAGAAGPVIDGADDGVDWGVVNGGPGQDGAAGGTGGGTQFYERLSGRLTVVAGGGNGGAGGAGGTGGCLLRVPVRVYNEVLLNITGNGGRGGAGGRTGDGGTVVIAYRTLDPGGDIQFLTHEPRPGAGGPGGAPSPESDKPLTLAGGGRGMDGDAGLHGSAPPVFIIRSEA